MLGLGEPNTAYAKYFVGSSCLKPLTDLASLFLANVTFEPGARNNVRRASEGGGQILVCGDGFGRYQEEGKEARSLKPGDAAAVPADVKHRRGAKKDSWFSHIAAEAPGRDTSNEWLGPVSDEQYDCLADETAG